MQLANIDEKYHFQDGDLFLGSDAGTGMALGITTPRHAITTAGARSGKGVAVIIPQLKKFWRQNVLVIDPKGEAAEETAADRKAMGHNVHVVDPFNFCDVPDEFRASYNPLDDIDIDSPSIREDIIAICDGIVMRHDPRHSMWDDNAQTLIAGVIGLVKSQAPEDKRNLIEVRNILRTADMDVLAETLAEDSGCGGLMQAAAGVINHEQGSQFVGNAKENTEWLDSPPMVDALGSSSFRLSDLKNADTSVYLVLPPNYLGQHGRFLRMFVRSAIEAMGKRSVDGKLLNKRCLFILDEFFSLGRIDEISKSCGLMPGFGLHLWPFLQDLGQLTSLYGNEAAATFFGNADLHQFFANTDQLTLDYMSKVSGTVTVADIGLPPSAPVLSQGQSITGSMMQSSQNSTTRAMGAGIGALSNSVGSAINAAAQAEYQDQMNLYQQQASRVGRPVYSPAEMASLVQRRDDVVADLMFCVCNGSDDIFVKPAPFFRQLPPTQEERSALITKESVEVGKFIKAYEYTSEPIAWWVFSPVLWAIGGLVMVEAMHNPNSLNFPLFSFGFGVVLSILPAIPITKFIQRFTLDWMRRVELEEAIEQWYEENSLIGRSKE